MLTEVLNETGRKIVITGHYGSGKTEFAVSLAMRLAAEKTRRFQRLAIVDLDIVNPYFRSRECRSILEESGIAVYGSAFTGEVTAELPALGADVRTPLEDEDCCVIIDAGGNAAGAIVLNQFRKYLTGDDTSVLAVVNANRPDTSDVPGAIEHIKSIEEVTGLQVTSIVNNSHLLRKTTVMDVAKGHDLCLEICGVTGKKLCCDCYPEGIITPEELAGISHCLMPLGLFMRPSWLDR